MKAKHRPDVAGFSFNRHTETVWLTKKTVVAHLTMRICSTDNTINSFTAHNVNLLYEFVMDTFNVNSIQTIWITNCEKTKVPPYSKHQSLPLI